MVLFGLLFVWCPIFGIIAYALYLSHQNEMSVGKIGGLAVMLSFYLGGLAVTKELLGDFYTYSQYFYDVPQYNLWTYLTHFGKEPVYYGYTYLSYYLFMGNWNLFVISITVINYLLLSYSLLRIGIYLNASINNVIVSLFFMAFFFQEFAAIGNMLRQGLAQSITLVFFVRWYICEKRSWWIALCALGVHTSCLPILCLGMLPFIQKRMEWVTFFKLAMLSIVVAGMFFGLSGFLSGLPFVGYVFERFGNHEQLLAADSWQTEVGLQPSMVALLCLLGGMIYSLYQKQSRLETFSRLYVFINLNLILLLMMVVCHVLGMYYLLMRYFFYLYAFQNTLFLIFLHESSYLHKRGIQVLFVSLMMVYFYHQFSHNIFKYIPVVEAFVYPLPVYLFI